MKNSSVSGVGAQVGQRVDGVGRAAAVDVDAARREPRVRRRRDHRHEVAVLGQADLAVDLLPGLTGRHEQDLIQREPVGDLAGRDQVPVVDRVEGPAHDADLAVHGRSLTSMYHAGPQWTKRLLLTGDTISGTQAAAIGLVLEAVPADTLDDHVLALAEHIATIGHDLLVHNKRIVNLGVELMGRSTMQVLAGIHDALAHNAPEAIEFSRSIREKGVRGAVDERDAQFERAESRYRHT